MSLVAGSSQTSAASSHGAVVWGIRSGSNVPSATRSTTVGRNRRESSAGHVQRHAPGVHLEQRHRRGRARSGWPRACSARTPRSTAVRSSGRGHRRCCRPRWPHGRSVGASRRPPARSRPRAPLPAATRWASVSTYRTRPEPSAMAHPTAYRPIDGPCRRSPDLRARSFLEGRPDGPISIDDVVRHRAQRDVAHARRGRDQQVIRRRHRPADRPPLLRDLRRRGRSRTGAGPARNGEHAA